MEKEVRNNKFGFFVGVFVPTFLSIIGIILFLRLGYIVGNAGILGTTIIILISVSVTTATALAISSVASNTKVAAGGGYSIISRTLGIEVGGSVGIPLLLAQIISVAFYLFGFSEAWKFIFPSHHVLFVGIIAFASIFLLTFIKLRFAIMSQVVTFLFIVAALVSAYAGGIMPSAQVSYTGTYAELPFWLLFALFFPAVTGLMAGIGLSGELKDPRKDIPKGVLWAIGITTLIYIGTAWWFGFNATAQELISDNLIMVKLAAFAPLILLGVLTATYSSALTTFVGASRLLQALGGHLLVPYSSFFSKKTSGEPRNAIIFIAAVVLALLFVGEINTLAPVLTILFLITYATINGAVLTQQLSGVLSFRPLFKLHWIIPLYGVLSSFAIMFLINFWVGAGSFIFMGLIYFWISRKGLTPKVADIQTTMLTTISEWAARRLKERSVKIKGLWKPSLLFPVSTAKDLLGCLPLLRSMLHPNGVITVLGMDLEKKESTLKESHKSEIKELKSVLKKLTKEKILPSFTTVKFKEYPIGVYHALKAVEGRVFVPNLVFLPIMPSSIRHSLLQKILTRAKNEKIGAIFYDWNREGGLGNEEDIHIWLPYCNRKNNDLDCDLAILFGYRLYQNWAGKITLHTCSPKTKETSTKKHLNKLIYDARLPQTTEIQIHNESYLDAIKKAPNFDVHIIPITSKTDRKLLKSLSQIKDKSLVLTIDSSTESVFA